MSTKPAVARTEIPPIPDFLGTGIRVQTISDLITQGQDQLQRFHATRLLYGDELTDPLPDAQSKNGHTETYAERIKSLESGIEALFADNQDITEELTAEAVRRRKVHGQRIEAQNAKAAEANQ